MFTFPPALISIIKQLDHDGLEESCGYCYKDGQNWVCIQVDNVDNDKREHFSFSPEDMIDFDTISSEKLVWHTHVKSEHTSLSSDDIRTAKAWPHSILMFNMKTGLWDYYDPSAPTPDYVGRTWIYSYQNCYNLVQDYYHQELGIELTDYYLEDPRAWIDPSWSMFTQHIEESGFSSVDKDDIRDNDLLLFKIGRTDNPNHIGVILDASSGLFLHHIGGQLSAREYLNRSYMKRLISVWRHETLN